MKGEHEAPMHHSLGRKILTSKRSALALMSFEVADWTWCSEYERKKGNEIFLCHLEK